uniref:hypothetical protein n=1 Tax=Ndongobacter massiliensis TaxID=1871025 RepID=UPI0009312734|nr:hypothetical protein [Ndongobacter massiliensis]
MQTIVETVFDLFYLSTVFYLGIQLLRRSGGKRLYVLYGSMALILGFGDTFHLLPRAYALWTKGLPYYVSVLGLGKLITSVTMTFFYVLLYYVWRERYSITGKKELTAGIWGLAIIHILLCFLPKNGWFRANPPVFWGIIRNIPFVLLGTLLIVLLYCSAQQKQDRSFRFLWLTIFLSFAFYIPVVLWAGAVPIIGALMIPKTIAYMWTIWIGYQDLKGVQ